MDADGARREGKSAGVYAVATRNGNLTGGDFPGWQAAYPPVPIRSTSKGVVW